jgi:hypothetical protein
MDAVDEDERQGGQASFISFLPNVAFGAGEEPIRMGEAAEPADG